MEERQEVQREANIIKNALFALKKNLFLLLAIIIVATSLGLGYTYIKKPNYTANVRVNFSIGENTEATTSTINEMRMYIDSIIYFSGQGVVLDRANDYYAKWLDKYQQDYYAQGKTIEDFYDAFEHPKKKGETDYNRLFKEYSRKNLTDETSLTAGAISTKTEKTDNATNWIYTVSYTDSNQLDAYEKAHILVLAYKHELYWDSDLQNTFPTDKIEQYFTNLDVNIDSLGFDGVVSNVSKLKIMIIAFIIGLVLALAVIYVKSKFDNTIKDKEVLERITGVQVVGSIGYIRGKDKNAK